MDAPAKGSPENPIAIPDLPWTCPADGLYHFHHRDWNDTHTPKPLRAEPMKAGNVVRAMSPSGTPLH